MKMINFSLNAKSLMILSLVLSILFILTLGYVILSISGDWQLAKESPRVEIPLVKNEESEALIAHLPKYHLFGAAFSKEGEVPLSNLQLRVTGIVKNEMENPLLSKAYISIAGEPSKIYKIGDSLPYGVKVYAITSHAIILENDGQLEKLPLLREKLKFKARNIEELA